MSNVELHADSRQAIIDEEHLRLLSLAHYIDGALCILFFSLFIFHLVFFLFIASNPQAFPPSSAGHPAPPQGMFQAMGVVLGGLILLGWAFGALTIYVGRCIKRRAKRGLTLIVACLNLVFMPIGTLLGVATILVLSRSSVRKAYEVQQLGS
jgi:nitrate reductase gamma subunit